MSRKPNTKCEQCNKPLYRRPCELSKYDHVLCIDCRSSISSMSAKIGADKKYEQYIDKWKRGLESAMKGSNQISNHIRRYLFDKFNNQCSKCGWGEVNPYTHKIPLEVEHKDGDHTNNTEDNLELLCPNCHSLTPTYKGANKGNGRYSRTQRYKSDKSY